VLSLPFNSGDASLNSLKDSLFDFGITDFAKAWIAIKKVWASKFNERAFLSIRKIGAKLD
jgi:hypothetical protein